MLYKIAEEDKKNKYSTNVDVIGAGLGALGLNAVVPYIRKKEMRIESKLSGPENRAKKYNIDIKAKQEILDKYKRMYEEAMKKIEELDDSFSKGKINEDLYRQKVRENISKKVHAEMQMGSWKSDINDYKYWHGPRVRFYNRASKMYDKVHRLKVGAQAGATGLGLYAIGKTLYNAYHSKNDDKNQNNAMINKYVIPSGALGLSLANMSRGAIMYSDNKKFNAQNKEEAENKIKDILARYGGKDLDLKDIDKTKVFFKKRLTEEMMRNPEAALNSLKYTLGDSNFDKWTDFLDNYKTGNLKRNVGAALFGVGSLGAALSSLLIGKNAYKDLKSNKNSEQQIN